MRRNTTNWLLVSLMAIFTGLSLTGCPANEGSPLGTNLADVADWSGEWPFIDAFKTSRPWISGTYAAWNDGRELDLDENGWVRSLEPGQMARTVLFWAQSDGYPAGQYIVLYDGEGTVDYGSGASYNTELSVSGRHVLDVVPENGGISMYITSTNPSDYMRNIRVVMPGGTSTEDTTLWLKQAPSVAPETYVAFEDCEDTDIFFPEFLKKTEPFKVLRYMDWMKTNGSEQVNWEDRPKPSDCRWSEKGIPVEIMCELSNRLMADPWFCMPHMANDDYIRNFARLVRDTLNPELKVYLEWSNEVWNYGFDQAHYAMDRGIEMDLCPDNQWVGAYYYTAIRSVDVFRIWEEEFGGTDRLVRVIATQAVSTWASECLLSYGEAYKSCDALAMAAYFGGELGGWEEVDRTREMTLDEMFVALETECLPRVVAWTSNQRDKANEYGVKLMMYEGGQHMVGVGQHRVDPAINALFDAANRDPRIGALYTQYLNEWWEVTASQNDGLPGMFCHYVNCDQFGSYGRWGALEYMTQSREDAPKYDAVLSFIEDQVAGTEQPWVVRSTGSAGGRIKER
ncbi:MAG: hypothetical protein GY851_12580 [bacterium]|nr:hypothetical protein [bacterium]